MAVADELKPLQQAATPAEAGAQTVDFARKQGRQGFGWILGPANFSVL